MTGTFQGVGSLQYTNDNKRVYAYTGSLAINNSGDQEVLRFQTTSEYLVVRVTPFYDAFNNNENLLMKINFNDTLIYSEEMEFSEGYSDNITKLIIPPFTDVQITLYNSGASTNLGVVLVGTAHGAIEQFNLEVVNE